MLTKADLCDNPDAFIQQIRDLDPMLMVEQVNSLDAATRRTLGTWCRNSQTVAFLGSSGVGKSTLVNTLNSAQLLNGETGSGYGGVFVKTIAKAATPPAHALCRYWTVADY